MLRQNLLQAPDILNPYGLKNGSDEVSKLEIFSEHKLFSSYSGSDFLFYSDPRPDAVSKVALDKKSVSYRQTATDTIFENSNLRDSIDLVIRKLETMRDEIFFANFQRERGFDLLTSYRDFIQDPDNFNNNAGLSPISSIESYFSSIQDSNKFIGLEKFIEGDIRSIDDTSIPTIRNYLWQIDEVTTLLEPLDVYRGLANYFIEDEDTQKYQSSHDILKQAGLFPSQLL